MSKELLIVCCRVSGGRYGNEGGTTWLDDLLRLTECVELSGEESSEYEGLSGSIYLWTLFKSGTARPSYLII
jgi:hypothetical protein